MLTRVERGVVRFTHALYREELLGDLDEDRRRSLHGKAAVVPAGALDPPLVDIAAHLLAANPARAAEAADAALRAAEAFVAALAFEDAGTLVQRVLDEIPALDDGRRGELSPFATPARTSLLSRPRRLCRTGTGRDRSHELCRAAATLSLARGHLNRQVNLGSPHQRRSRRARPQILRTGLAAALPPLAVPRGLCALVPKAAGAGRGSRAPREKRRNPSTAA